MVECVMKRYGVCPSISVLSSLTLKRLRLIDSTFWPFCQRADALVNEIRVWIQIHAPENAIRPMEIEIDMLVTKTSVRSTTNDCPYQITFEINRYRDTRRSQMSSWKALVRGRTYHLSNIFADHKIFRSRSIIYCVIPSIHAL